LPNFNSTVRKLTKLNIGEWYPPALCPHCRKKFTHKEDRDEYRSRDGDEWDEHILRHQGF